MNQDLVISVRRPPGSPHVYRLGNDEIRVGRSPECHVRLPDPAISALHLVFRRTATGFEMLDPGSKHGVRVGQSRLPRGTARAVEHAELLSLGPFTMEVFLESATLSTTDHVETHRLAHALALEKANRIRAPWLISVKEGAHRGEILAPTADQPVRLDPKGAALGPEDPIGTAALTLSVGHRGALLVERHDTGGDAGDLSSRVSSLGAGDQFTVGDSLLEVRVGEHRHDASQPSWTPFELTMLAILGIALTAIAVAWWGA